MVSSKHTRALTRLAWEYSTATATDRHRARELAAIFRDDDDVHITAGADINVHVEEVTSDIMQALQDVDIDIMNFRYLDNTDRFVLTIE